MFLKRYYWSAYTRLAWNKPALTITANANFLGSGRFTHPNEDRGITMREAARLQSFDDSFTFYTADGPRGVTENIGTGLDMIGEAVPPLLGRAIAQIVAVPIGRDKGTEPWLMLFTDSTRRASKDADEPRGFDKNSRRIRFGILRDSDLTRTQKVCCNHVARQAGPYRANRADAKGCNSSPCKQHNS